MMAGPPTDAKPMPFGVFFCHGRHFNAFHCRFRDIARGKWVSESVWGREGECVGEIGCGSGESKGDVDGGKEKISVGGSIDDQSSWYSIACRDMSCYYVSLLFRSYTDCIITPTPIAVFFIPISQSSHYLAFKCNWSLDTSDSICIHAYHKNNENCSKPDIL